MIDRPESVTTQINLIIRERIRTGTYRPGSRLPSEDELANEFGVSRSTLRNSVNALVTEGVILRRHGDGSYVNDRAYKFNAQLQNLWSFPQLIRESGYNAEIDQVEGNSRVAKSDEAAALELAPGIMVYVVERVFLANRVPVIFSTNIIPFDLLVHSTPIMDKELTIYEFMHRYCGIDLVYSSSEIHAVRATNTIREKLRVAQNAPILHFQDTFFTKESKPVAMGTNYYNDQLLTMRLVRSKA